jgi:hypothetical protein
MHGMGYHLVAAPGCTTANGLWVCFGVGTPPARVRSRVPGVWLHLCMELGIGCVLWVEGRMRSRFTGSSGVLLLMVGVAWRDALSARVHRYTCVY